MEYLKESLAVGFICAVVASFVFFFTIIVNVNSSETEEARQEICYEICGVNRYRFDSETKLCHCVDKEKKIIEEYHLEAQCSKN